MECYRDGCPSGRLSHLHRGTLELCQSDHWILGHLPDQGPSPPIAQFGQAASSRKSLGSSKLQFKNDGDLQRCRTFFGTLFCALTQSCLVALWTIPFCSWLGFCSDIHCQCGTLYRQVCAFPNHVLSIEYTTGGLQVIETSQG